MSKHVLRASRRSVVTALGLLSLAAAGLVLPAAFAGPDEGSGVRQDFNGDGYQDLAVSAPRATVNGKLLAGHVAVVYGSANGLDLHRKKVYSQATAGVPGSPEEVDVFGDQLAAADLDGDGYTDLLVVAGGEKLRQDGVNRSGSQTVLWGGSAGLGAGTVLPAFGSGRFQVGLTATGDFNGDGHQDLLRSEHVEFGPFGRDGRPASVQNAPRLAGDDQQADRVTAGDVDGDGATDLVTSSMSGPDGDEDYDKYINYVPGSHDGLRPATVLKDAQGRGFATYGDGRSMKLGDLNGDGRADLVLGGRSLAVFNGTPNGPDTTVHRVIDQDTPGVPGTEEEADTLGSTLAVGDVDGDGYGDIVAGDKTEAVGSVVSAGSFTVVPGGPDGPTGAGSRAFTQNSAGVPGASEKYDSFGYDVHVVDGNGDGRAEPVVGAGGENDGAGAVWVFRSASTGVTAKNPFSFGAGTLGTVAKNGSLGTRFPN